MAQSPRRVVVRRPSLRPTPTQLRFLSGRTRLAAFLSGYGGGKTFAGAQKALQLVAANPGCVGAIVAPTWRMLERLSLDAFKRTLPREIVASEHKSERRIDFVNGARVYFGSADNAGSLEGMNLAWFWIDEARLVSAEAWRVMVGRLRERHARLLQGYVTTTPAQGWLAEEFDAGLPDREVFRCSTVENAANLAPGFIDNLRRSYSARLAKSLIDGEFSVISGQVYEEFDAARHAVDWEYDPRWRTLLGIDFGVSESSVLFAQETGDFPWHLPDGRVLPPHSLVIVDELQLDGVPTARMVEAVKARWKGRRIDAIHCDPAGAARDIASGMPSVHLLREAFGDVVRFETAPAERWIANGIARVQGALAPVDGAPTLYVARGLVNETGRRGIVKSLRGYRYEEKAGRSTGIPVHDEYSHACDAGRYLVIGAQNARRSTHDFSRPVYFARQG